MSPGNPLKVVAFLAGLFLCALPSAADSWPQWRGAAQDGSSNADKVFSRPFDLRLAWSQPIGAGYSGISIAKETVVTMFSDGVSDFVAAFALSSGDERWRVNLGSTYKGRHGSEDGPSSTPAIAGGRVFAVGPKGRFMAVDLSSGTVLWELDLVEEHEAQLPWYGFGASPVPVGEAVYLPAFTKTGLSGLAFRQDNGQLLWSVAGNWLDYHPAVESRTEDGLLVSDGSDLALVDFATGSERFRFTHSTDRDLAYPQLVPIGSDKLLLTFEAHSDLYRLEPGANPPLTRIWRSRDLRDSYVPPVATGGTIYGMSGIFLVAVDVESGARRWKSRQPGARGLILVDGHLVLLASGGEVVVVEANPESYAEISRIRATNRGGYTPPSFANGRILVRNTSTLACVEVLDVRTPAALTVAKKTLPPPGAFRDFIVRLEASADPAGLIDEWWAAQASFPIVESESVVHFVYRGLAADVALLGDMTHDLYGPEPMLRVANTDLFYRSFEYDREGLWSYAFLVDLERVIADPMNTKSVVGIPEQNPVSVGYQPPDRYSLLEMPGWKEPEFLSATDNGGGLEEVPFASESVYRKRDLTVYLPRGYSGTTRSYPVLYVLGSTPWLEHARLENAFNNLMGSVVEPAIAVLIPYHDGSLDRMDSGSYAQLMLDEIVPLIKERYRVRTPNVLLAAGDDGASALATAMRDPQKFVRLALHSPRITADDLPDFGAAARGPEAAYVEWSRYEPRILDENIDYRALAKQAAKLLDAAGTQVVESEVITGPGWKSWSARLDRSLRFLLPLVGK